MSETKKWYEQSGAEGDICVSTRVRFARNLSRFPFPAKMTDEQARTLIDETSRALAASRIGGDFRLIDMEQASATERSTLVERHLISPDLANGSRPRAVLVSSDESVSVMINEEDHLRIQVLEAGLAPEKALERAKAIDDVFDAALGYAFDEKLGYLTSCPTNLGTGMRVSVMLHLPALEAAHEISGMISGAGGMGFTARGIYGEGSAAEGSLYQFSNRITLGYDEDDVAKRMLSLAKQIITRERSLRGQMLARDRDGLEDSVWRAVGTLKYARRIDTAEALELLGRVRTGASLGVIPADYGRLNGLLWAVRPSSIVTRSGKDELDPSERDKLRAELLHEAIEPAKSI